MRCIKYGLACLSFAIVAYDNVKVGANAQVPPPTDCSALIQAAKLAGDDATKTVNDAKTKADQETGDDKHDMDICATGYITMEHNHFALDIPEITMKNQDMSLDIPQITIRQQHIAFGTPSVECKPVKTGQYPEFTCHDTWIITDLPFGGSLKTKGVPACTTTWHDITRHSATPS